MYTPKTCHKYVMMIKCHRKCKATTIAVWRQQIHWSIREDCSKWDYVEKLLSDNKRAIFALESPSKNQRKQFRNNYRIGKKKYGITNMSRRFLECRYCWIAVRLGSPGGTCLILIWASATVSFSSLHEKAQHDHQKIWKRQTNCITKEQHPIN